MIAARVNNLSDVLSEAARLLTTVVDRDGRGTVALAVGTSPQAVSQWHGLPSLAAAYKIQMAYGIAMEAWFERAHRTRRRNR